jgi:hypothetical protein
MARWGDTLTDPKVWARDIAFTAGTATVLAILGPFGTEQAPLQQRLVENFAFGFASFPLLWPPMRLALRWGERARLHELFVLIAGLIVLTAPVTLVSELVGRLLHPGARPEGFMPGYFVVLAMVLPFGLAYLMVERRLFRPPPPAPEAAAAPVKLFDRLPPRLGRDILALQAEDHYVRVHTRQGSDLILMRLADAIDELGGLEGERVHRSWWVARAAVAAARAEGRRLTLTLANGVEVPVTREVTPRLRRAGWAV